ncbi:MAG: Asp-tRNA(Asn)/Glu-tRNA(Gln) amidotransferase subunit GatB [Anaerolineae bacterium]|nr:Asp-tRNA(Asn)/Glu-tRNA(Gln) amidotransferase subunit GatB [Anaerolineae bacterium]
MKYEAVIGLEVHAQVHTRTKMYCGCPVIEDTGQLEPNTYVCPVCLALPGALPVVNRRVVELGILTGLALNGTLQPVNVFARKSYFYPDLPKGYQISQYELPLMTNGYLEIETSNGIKKIGITRLHMEEDTAKLYHEAGKTLIDFNRAGIPLLEIVSAPEMHTVEEVKAYAMTLRDVLVTLGLSTGDMEKGQIRFEANISVHPEKSQKLGTRTEVKNLNSFRALAKATDYEIQRQISLLRDGEMVIQQTMGWDEQQGKTYPQRSKEESHDYRYFPDPDIPPVEIPTLWIEEIRNQLPELPLAKKQRFIKTYRLGHYDAQLLVADYVIADFFEETVGRRPNLSPQDIANWITGEIFRLLKERQLTLKESGITPPKLAKLLQLWHTGTINNNVTKVILAEVFNTGIDPEVIVKREGLAQISDAQTLNTLIDGVITAHPQQVTQYLHGKHAVLSWFMGQVMKETQGKANPKEVQNLLRIHLEQRRFS